VLQKCTHFAPEHFESSQFENYVTETGKKKLKPNAVPTLFNIPNPPPSATSSRRVLKRLSTSKSTIQTQQSSHSKQVDHCYLKTLNTRVPINDTVSRLLTLLS
jgi:hypothetical protein